jgi:hypothetical protein
MSVSFAGFGYRLLAIGVKAALGSPLSPSAKSTRFLLMTAES